MQRDAGKLKIEVLQVVLTQMEEHIPGVMAPTGSLAQARLWMQDCHTRFASQLLPACNVKGSGIYLAMLQAVLRVL